MKCETCKFATKASQPEYYRYCFRYPKVEQKGRDMWCGEWQNTMSFEDVPRPPESASGWVGGKKHITLSERFFKWFQRREEA